MDDVGELALAPIGWSRAGTTCGLEPGEPSDRDLAREIESAFNLAFGWQVPSPPSGELVLSPPTGYRNPVSFVPAADFADRYRAVSGGGSGPDTSYRAAESFITLKLGTKRFARGDDFIVKLTVDAWLCKSGAHTAVSAGFGKAEATVGTLLLENGRPVEASYRAAERKAAADALTQVFTQVGNTWQLFELIVIRDRCTKDAINALRRDEDVGAAIEAFDFAATSSDSACGETSAQLLEAAISAIQGDADLAVGMAKLALGTSNGARVYENTVANYESFAASQAGLAAQLPAIDVSVEHERPDAAPRQMAGTRPKSASAGTQNRIPAFPALGLEIDLNQSLDEFAAAIGCSSTELQNGCKYPAARGMVTARASAHPDDSLETVSFSMFMSIDDPLLRGAVMMGQGFDQSLSRALEGWTRTEDNVEAPQGEESGGDILGDTSRVTSWTSGERGIKVHRSDAGGEYFSWEAKIELLKAETGLP